MAVEPVVIDSSAWIFALRRAPLEAVRDRVDAVLAEGRAALVPPIRMELVGGARTPVERDRLRQRLLALIQIPFVDDDWDQAEAWGFGLRRKGVTVASFDLLIAAPVFRTGALLLHADDHFDLLARHTGLKVESLVATVRDGA